MLFYMLLVLFVVLPRCICQSDATVVKFLGSHNPINKVGAPRLLRFDGVPSDVSTWIVALISSQQQQQQEIPCLWLGPSINQAALEGLTDEEIAALPVSAQTDGLSERLGEFWCRPIASEPVGYHNFTFTATRMDGSVITFVHTPGSYYVSLNGVLHQDLSVPIIRSVSPQRGSIAGGTVVTINGDGFTHINDNSQPVMVSVSGEECDLLTLNATTITCISRPMLPLSVIGQLASAASPQQARMLRQTHDVRTQKKMSRVTSLLHGQEDDDADKPAERKLGYRVDHLSASPPLLMQSYDLPLGYPILYAGSNGVLVQTLRGTTTGDAAIKSEIMKPAMQNLKARLGSGTASTADATRHMQLVMDIHGTGASVGRAKTDSVNSINTRTMATIFVPNITGWYNLYIASSHSAKLFITSQSQSMDDAMDPAIGIDATSLYQIAFCPSLIARHNYFAVQRQQSQPTYLQASRAYYIEAVQDLTQVQLAENYHMSVSLRISNWGFASERTSASSAATYKLIVSSTIEPVSDLITLDPKLSRFGIRMRVQSGASRIDRITRWLPVDISAANLANEIDSMFSINCDAVQPDAARTFARHDFERNIHSWTAIGASAPALVRGSSFCGRGSMQVQDARAAIFDVMTVPSTGPRPVHYNIDDFPFICMAYRIPSNTLVNMVVRLNNIHMVSLRMSAKASRFSAVPAVGDWNILANDQWQHSCFNLQAALRTDPAGRNISRQVLANSRLFSTLVVTGIWLAPAEEGGDYGGKLYIDEFVIMSTSRTLQQRLQLVGIAEDNIRYHTPESYRSRIPSQDELSAGNGLETWLDAILDSRLENVTVAAIDPRSWKVTWDVDPCGDFSQLELSVIEPTPDETTQTSYARVHNGTVGISGPYYLSLNAGSWAQLTVGNRSSEVAAALQAIGGSTLDIAVSGHSSCVDMNFFIAVQNAQQAAQGMISGVLGDFSELTGSQLYASLTPIAEAGTSFSHFGGSGSLFVPVSGYAPIVRASVGGVEAVCDPLTGRTYDSCAHVPAASKTPLITEIQPLEAHFGDVIQLKGRDLEALHYTIRYGTINCVVIESDAGSITCKLMASDAGSTSNTHGWTVLLEGRGQAIVVQSPKTAFSLNFQVLATDQAFVVSEAGGSVLRLPTVGLPLNTAGINASIVWSQGNERARVVAEVLHAGREELHVSLPKYPLTAPRSANYALTGMIGVITLEVAISNWALAAAYGVMHAGHERQISRSVSVQYVSPKQFPRFAAQVVQVAPRKASVMGGSIAVLHLDGLSREDVLAFLGDVGTMKVAFQNQLCGIQQRKVIVRNAVLMTQQEYESWVDSSYEASQQELFTVEIACRLAIHYYGQGTSVSPVVSLPTGVIISGPGLAVTFATDVYSIYALDINIPLLMRHRPDATLGLLRAIRAGTAVGTDVISRAPAFAKSSISNVNVIQKLRIQMQDDDFVAHVLNSSSLVDLTDVAGSYGGGRLLLAEGIGLRSADTEALCNICPSDSVSVRNCVEMVTLYVSIDGTKAILLEPQFASIAPEKQRGVFSEPSIRMAKSLQAIGDTIHWSHDRGIQSRDGIHQAGYTLGSFGLFGDTARVYKKTEFTNLRFQQRWNRKDFTVFGSVRLQHFAENDGVVGIIDSSSLASNAAAARGWFVAASNGPCKLIIFGVAVGTDAVEASMPSTPTECQGASYFEQEARTRGFIVVSAPLGDAEAGNFHRFMAWRVGLKVNVQVGGAVSSAEMPVFVPNDQPRANWPLRIGYTIPVATWSFPSDSEVIVDDVFFVSGDASEAGWKEFTRHTAVAHSVTATIRGKTLSTKQKLSYSRRTTPYITDLATHQSSLGAIVKLLGEQLTVNIGPDNRPPVVFLGESLCATMNSAPTFLDCMANMSSVGVLPVTAFSFIAGVAVTARGVHHTPGPQDIASMSVPLELKLEPFLERAEPACMSLVGGPTDLIGHFGPHQSIQAVMFRSPATSFPCTNLTTSDTRLHCNLQGIAEDRLLEGLNQATVHQGVLEITYISDSKLVTPMALSATCTPIIASNGISIATASSTLQWSPISALGENSVNAHVDDAYWLGLEMLNGKLQLPLPANAVGEIRVKFFVAGSGYAAIMSDRLASSQVKLTLMPLLSSITPTEGKVGGGYVITVAGAGFTTETHRVSVDGQTCAWIPSSKGLLQCLVPPLLSERLNTSGSRAAPVFLVSRDGSPITSRPLIFTYSWQNDPILSAVTFADDDTLRISGLNLDYDASRLIAGPGVDVVAPSIMVGRVPCTPLGSAARSILCQLTEGISGGLYAVSVSLPVIQQQQVISVQAWSPIVSTVPAAVVGLTRLPASSVHVAAAVDAVPLRAVGSLLGGKTLVLKGRHLPAAADVTALTVCGVTCSPQSDGQDGLTSLRCKIPLPMALDPNRTLATSDLDVASTERGYTLRLASGKITAQTILELQWRWSRQPYKKCVPVSVLWNSTITKVHVCPNGNQLMITRVKLSAGLGAIIDISAGEHLDTVKLTAAKLTETPSVHAELAARTSLVQEHVVSSLSPQCPVNISFQIGPSVSRLPDDFTQTITLRSPSYSSSTDDTAPRIMVSDELADAAMPSVDAITPAYGSVAGGYPVTLFGRNFCAKEELSVYLSGVACTVLEVTSTVIVCKAGARNNTDSAAIPALVLCSQSGAALPGEGAGFRYVHTLSSPHTWAGPSGLIPELVVVPAGEVLLVDADLSNNFALISFGEIVFDPLAELRITTSHILAVDGGKVLCTRGQGAPQLNIELKAPKYSSEVLNSLSSAIANFSASNSSLVGAFNGGSIVFEQAVEWVASRIRAQEGDDAIVVENADGLAVGDDVYVISATAQSLHLDVATIASVVGSRLRTSTGLAAQHGRIRQEYGGKVLQLDAYLLNRKRGIVIDARNNTNGAMIVVASTASDTYAPSLTLHGVTLRGLGIRGYRGAAGVRVVSSNPLGSDGVMTSITKCVFDGSVMGALQVAGVHGVEIQANIFYGTRGVAVSVLGGNEQNVIVQDNFVLATLASMIGTAADVIGGGYMIGSPAVKLVRNVAAGGGVGFILSSRIGDGVQDPSASRISRFAEIQSNDAFCNRGDGWRIEGPFEPDVISIISKSTSAFNGGDGIKWGTSSRVWLRGARIAYNGGTALEGPRSASPGYDCGAEDILIVAPDETRISTKTAAIITPDQDGFDVVDVGIAEYSNVVAVRTRDASRTVPSLNIGFSTRFRNVTWHNSPLRLQWTKDHEGIIIDADGTFSGQQGSVNTAGVVIKPACALAAAIPGCARVQAAWFRGITYVDICRGRVWKRVVLSNVAPLEVVGKPMDVTLANKVQAVPWTSTGEQAGGWVFLAPVNVIIELRLRSTYDAWWLQRKVDLSEFDWITAPLSQSENIFFQYTFAADLPREISMLQGGVAPAVESELPIAWQASNTSAAFSHASYYFDRKSRQVWWVASGFAPTLTSAANRWKAIYCPPEGCLGVRNECVHGRIRVDSTSITTSEKQPSVVIRLVREQGTCGDLYLTVKTASVTADSDLRAKAQPMVDYVPVNQQIVFLHEETEKFVHVALLDSGVYVFPNRKFVVEISDPNGEGIVSQEAAQAMVELIDGDQPITVELTNLESLTKGCLSSVQVATDGLPLTFSRSTSVGPAELTVSLNSPTHPLTVDLLESSNGIMLDVLPQPVLVRFADGEITANVVLRLENTSIIQPRPVVAEITYLGAANLSLVTSGTRPNAICFSAVEEATRSSDAKGWIPIVIGGAAAAVCIVIATLAIVGRSFFSRAKPVKIESLKTKDIKKDAQDENRAVYLTSTLRYAMGPTQDLQPIAADSRQISSPLVTRSRILRKSSVSCDANAAQDTFLASIASPNFRAASSADTLQTPRRGAISLNAKRLGRPAGSQLHSDGTEDIGAAEIVSPLATAESTKDEQVSSPSFVAPSRIPIKHAPLPVAQRRTGADDSTRKYANPLMRS